MTNEELQKIQEAIKAHSQMILDAPDPQKAATRYLYEVLGIHNKDGSLTSEYGGDYTDKDHPVYTPDGVLDLKEYMPVFTTAVSYEMIQDLKAAFAPGHGHGEWEEALKEILFEEIMGQYDRWWERTRNQ